MTRALLLSIVVLGFLSPPSLTAQWGIEGEVGASMFFGNTRQTNVTTRGALERGDSIFEFSTDAVFNYGEATNQDGLTFVNKRSWASRVSLDYMPLAKLSPFFFARVESSLEKRLALRHSSGVGGKVRLVSGQVTRIDLSGALLAERTRPRGEVTVQDDVTLMRWSARFRMRRSFSDGRMIFDSENFYQPVFNTFGDFTFNSKNSLSYELNRVVALRLSFVDNYDSGAIARGAQTNNDGQLLFSVRSRF